ncbi:MAG TPA: DapH/DapD/GlmU-related protein [Dehalococcoidia bacterium]|nr:DapH/DapD/GlmU-related protein [Dehalococcoidia bacterium]
MADALARPRRSKPADPLAALRAQAEERLRHCARLIGGGVRIVDPATTYVEPGVEVGEGTVLHPNTTISGETAIGRRCRIGPNTVIADSRIGDDVAIVASFLEGAVVEAHADVGPFSHLRPGAHLEEGVHVGNYVEVKASRLGRGTKVGHFSYIGDARIGANVNIGAGTVTCNYDGEKKQETVIEDEAFIGSDTMLVAPVRVGRGAVTGAGSVVTRDVPAGAQVVGAPATATGKQARRRPSQRQVQKKLG